MNNKRNNSVTISGTFYDLTQTISRDMPVYPGDPKPEFQSIATIEKDSYNVTRIIIGSHTGTHVDAQRHFISSGNSVDIEPLSKFIGECITLDLSKSHKIGEGVTYSDLEGYSKIIKPGDIILMYTGTSDNWMKNENIKNNFTYLEPSAAEWMTENNIKCVGVDTFSVERYGSKEGLTHIKLLSNGIGIIENLNSNLKKIRGRRMYLVSLPLLLREIDGSPARTIAFEIL